MNQLIKLTFLIFANLLLVMAIPLMVYRLLTKKETMSSLLNKLSFTLPHLEPGKEVIMIHAASVGETVSAYNLIKQVLKDKNTTVLLTTITMNSYKVFTQKNMEGVTHSFLPIDIPIILYRFLSHIRPRKIIFFEAEVWPSMLLLAPFFTDEIYMVNARMSDNSFTKWKHCLWFTKLLFSSFKMVYPQSKQDSEKLEYFFSNYKFLGNIKYDNEKLTVNSTLVDSLHISTADRKIFVAASTHKSEEEIVISAYLKAKHEVPNLFLILAPRHPNRIDEVIKILDENKLSYVLHTESQGKFNDNDVYIVDTIGELGNFFEIADVVFIGGSFIKIGGHNPIEPAFFKKIIITGSYFHNFVDVYENLAENKAVIIVQNENELARNVADSIVTNKYVQYPENAYKLVCIENISEKVWYDIKKNTA